MVEKIKLQEIKFGFSDEDFQIRADLQQYPKKETYSSIEALSIGATVSAATIAKMKREVGAV